MRDLLDWVFRVDPDLLPEDKLRARFVLLASVLLAIWGAVAAVTASDLPMWMRVTVGCIVFVLAFSYVLCRRGHITLAAFILIFGAFADFQLIVFAGGTRSPAASAAVALPLLVGFAWDSRAAIATTLAFCVSVVAAEVALTLGWYSVPEMVFSEPWKPLTRQLVFVPLIALVMRRAYDRVHAVLVAETRDAKSMEDEAVRRKEALEAEVDRFTEELHRRTRVREDLAVAFADELHAPLEHIASSLRGVTDVATGEDAERVQDLSRAADAADRMRRMIERFLEHARIGSSVELSDNVDLAEVVGDVVEEHRAAGATKVAWRVDELPTTLGDATLLRTVVENLVTNAVKFSRDREQPIVHVGYDAATSALFVKDNGVGFDMAYAPKLFKPFQRMHGRSYEGMGVGLANVRRIAELHGGACWAEAAVDQGATFFVGLPVQARRAE